MLEEDNNIDSKYDIIHKEGKTVARIEKEVVEIFEFKGQKKYFFLLSLNSSKNWNVVINCLDCIKAIIPITKVFIDLVSSTPSLTQSVDCSYVYQGKIVAYQAYIITAYNRQLKKVPIIDFA